MPLTGTEYTVARACEGCKRSLGPDAAPQRMYCDSCRVRRQAATYLRVAHDLLVDVDRGLATAIDDVVGRLGAPS